MRHKTILAICLLLFLSACSVPIQKNLAARTYQEQIDMSGRLSAQYEQKTGQQAIHISFNWSQTPEQTFITLKSPTGQTLATLLINPEGAQLTESNKPPRYASDANQLLYNMLGWPLPIAGLRNWLQGFVDDAHVTPITEASSKEIDIDGWHLRYAAWKTENNIERPKRLDLTRHTEQAGLVSLRIVVDEWN